MSDTGRQSFTDKAGATLKPDSQKSTTEQAQDFAKGKGDKVAQAVQPNSDKSGTQGAADAVTDNNTENNESLLAKAKNAVGLGQDE